MHQSGFVLLLLLSAHALLFPLLITFITPKEQHLGWMNGTKYRYVQEGWIIHRLRGGGDSTVMSSTLDSYFDAYLPNYELSKSFKDAVQSMGGTLIRVLLKKCNKIREDADKSAITDPIAVEAAKQLKLDQYCSKFLDEFNSTKTKQMLKKRKIGSLSSVLQDDEGNTKPIEDMTEEEKRDLFKRAMEYSKKYEKEAEEKKKRQEAEKERIKQERKERVEAARQARREQTKRAKEAEKQLKRMQREAKKREKAMLKSKSKKQTNSTRYVK
mmetsp:Transcript_4499/g.5978  ORF Transcript_4499/g.5978 Transcript_4499/m.5978 type:complete len:270 (-) Transcript_4499:193-1002(-)|eukprot:CAMPEP_0185261882 /NCGR_PEP_ID=MMETSP1359-20130426/10186_1 /TAXON_ID=552665 /ORGANISM="Bigelowiella longifila, Strain CCMP242" /LENGTH=269 /DNA_ID=CAMNT_0027848663 /DNA_START=94 /DNA_END=903 /DNA_ORIENTATION=-